MSYLYQPRQPSTCYRPQVFRNTRTSTADVQSLFCSVYVGGTLEATYRKPPASVLSTNYTFDIDVQTVTSRSSAPMSTAQTSIFNIWDKITVTTNSDVYRPYYLITGLEVLNDDGYLTLLEGTNETSSTLYSLPAIRPMGDQGLEDYYQPSATEDVLFLTHAPATQVVAPGDNFGISWLARGIEAAQLVFIRADASQHTLVIRSAADTSQEVMQTLGIGPANILGAANLIVLSGTLPVSLSEYVSYQFSVGTWSDSTYTRESETRYFVIGPACDWKVRLHWMNALGGIDQYTFCGQVVRKQTDTGDVGEIAHSIEEVQDPGYLQARPGSRGIIKTGIDTRLTIEIREPVTPDVGAWLRYLRKSPEVYIERDGTLHTCTILPGDSEYERSREANAVFTATVLVENEYAQEL